MPKKGYKQTEEHKNKIGNNRRGKIRSPEHCRSLSIALMGHSISEETGRKISLANKGKPSPHKGKTLEEICGKEKSISMRKKNSDRNKIYQNLPEIKEKKSCDHIRYHYSKEELEDLYLNQRLPMNQIADVLGGTTGSVWDRMKKYNIPRRTNSETLKGRKVTWGDKIGAAEKGKIVPESTRRLQSEQMFWRLNNDPEYVDKLVKGLNMKPNKQEIKLQELIDIACPNEYRFTGDGSVRIERCYPDFTNCNGKKKIIEHYGTYWHKPEEEQERIDKFAKYGFETLVIWEHELKDPVSVIQRIIEFADN